MRRATHFALILVCAWFSRFAAARIWSAKTPATGFSVRFFNVTSASGLAVAGKSIGRVLRRRFLGGNCITLHGTIERKSPVASSVVRTGKVELTTERGIFSLLARNASKTTLQ